MRYFPPFVTELLHRQVDALLRRSVDQWVARQAVVHVIQVGANDGVMADPVHEIVKRPNARAVLVEPVPEVFARLARTYASYPRVSCRQVAIVPDAGVPDVRFYRFAPKPGLPWDDVYTGWGSTQREHLERFRAFVPNFDQLVHEDIVPATTLAALFTSTGWAAVDLLQIDVEGLDVALVESIPFAAWSPRIIRFEHIHSDRERLRALLRRLQGIGYRTFSHGFDTLCVRGEEMSGFRLLHWVQRLHPAWFTPPA